MDFFSSFRIHPYQFSEIKSIVSEGSTLWIADLNTIKKLQDGQITILQTSKPLGSCGQMVVDSIARQIIVTQPFKNQIAVIDIKNGNTEFIGNGIGGFCDGTFEKAMFFIPAGLVMDSNRNLLLCDSGNSCIRVINRLQKIVTSIGTPKCKKTNYVHAFWNSPKSEEPISTCNFEDPRLIAFDSKSSSAIVVDGEWIRRLEFNENLVVSIGTSRTRKKNLLMWKGELLYSHDNGISKVQITNMESPSQKELASTSLAEIEGTLSGLCLDEWNNFCISYFGEKLMTLLRSRNLQWKHARLLWIGHLKEDKNSCGFATLPRDLVWEFIRILLE